MTIPFSTTRPRPRQPVIPTSSRHSPFPRSFAFGAATPAGAETRALLGEMGADLLRVLHGEEEYEYHGLLHPGDDITGELEIVEHRTQGRSLRRHGFRADAGHLPQPARRGRRHRPRHDGGEVVGW